MSPSRREPQRTSCSRRTHLVIGRHFGKRPRRRRNLTDSCHSSPRVSLPLIAVAQGGRYVGALQAIVPGNLTLGMLQNGWPVQAVTSLAICVTKVAAVGVDPSAARKGVGTLLLHACCDLYFTAGYRLVYGNYRRQDPPFLAKFYQAAGFDLPEKMVPVGLDGGLVVNLVADPGQLLFSLSRPTWRAR